MNFCSGLLQPQLNADSFGDIVLYLCFGENAIFKSVDSILDLTFPEITSLIEKLSEIHRKQKEEMEKMKRRRK